MLSLATLAGFAAGASLMGMVALSHQRAPNASDSDHVAASAHRSPGIAARESEVFFSAPNSQTLEPSSPWAFETATPDLPRGPGAKRPDLLGSPGG